MTDWILFWAQHFSRPVATEREFYRFKKVRHKKVSGKKRFRP